MDAQNTDLLFNVAQLLKQPVGSIRKLKLETSSLLLDGATEVQQGSYSTLDAQNVEGAAKATRVGDGLLVQGDVAARVQLECSRCLDNIDLPVEAALEEQFHPTVDVETGAPVQRADYEQDDTAFEIDANHIMDLSEPVRQALLVALPMKPLCSEDCKGLCPQCGANLNEGPCDCEPVTADNRWMGLKELRLEDFPAGDSALN